MSLSTVKYLSQIVLGTGGTISELADATPKANLDVLIGMTAGLPEPAFTSIRSIKPDLVAQSMQCKTILDACNTGGAAPYGADLSAGNTDLYYQDAPNKGSRTAAASLLHQRFRLAKAMLYWTAIRATHQQDAQIDFRLKPVWDGTNVPLVAAGAVALAGTSVGNERYTLGGASINGVAISGLQQMDVESGVQLEEEGSDGELYDSFCGIETAQPVVRLTGRTIEWWNTYGLGTALTALSLYLIQKNATGNWPNVNLPPKHIKLSATAGLILPDSTSGLKSQTTLRLQLQSPTVGAAALTVNTASDIT